MRISRRESGWSGDPNPYPLPIPLAQLTFLMIAAVQLVTHILQPFRRGFDP